jgi:hypothetical protein
MPPVREVFSIPFERRHFSSHGLLCTAEVCMMRPDTVKRESKAGCSARNAGVTSILGVARNVPRGTWRLKGHSARSLAVRRAFGLGNNVPRGTCQSRRAVPLGSSCIPLTVVVACERARQSGSSRCWQVKKSRKAEARRSPESDHRLSQRRRCPIFFRAWQHQIAEDISHYSPLTTHHSPLDCSFHRRHVRCKIPPVATTEPSDKGLKHGSHGPTRRGKDAWTIR